MLNKGTDPSKQAHPQPSSQTPTNKHYRFWRIYDDPIPFPRPQTRYEITMHRETARLPDLQGLECIHRILSGDHGFRNFVWTVGKRAIHDEVILVSLCPATVATLPPESIRAVSPGRIKKEIAKTTEKARAEWNVARTATPEYNRLMLQVTNLRKYLTETNAHSGKGRTFTDESRREVDAVRKAIARAIAEIRKHSTTIADHLQSNILYGGHGCWFYAGPRDAWDVDSPLPEWLSTELDNDDGEEELLDPDAIRGRWLSAKQDLTRKLSDPFAASRPKAEAIRELVRGDVWWAQGAAKQEFLDRVNSLFLNRPAYLSEGANANEVSYEEPESEAQTDYEWADMRDESDKTVREDEWRSDDRDASDFESER